MAYFRNGAFDSSVASLNYPRCLGAGFGKNVATAATQRLSLVAITFESGLELFLALADSCALVLPITFVAGDVEQIFVEIDIVTAYNLARLVDNLGGQPGLARYLESERAARIAYRQAEQRLHEMAVIEHRTVDQALGVLGVMLQILEMGRYHTPHPAVVETMKDGLRYRASDLRLGAPAELIDKSQRSRAPALEHEFHRAQMRRVGRQIVFNRLIVANVKENVVENAEVAVVVDSGKHSTLKHILKYSDSFQAHRLTSGVRP